MIIQVEFSQFICYVLGRLGIPVADTRSYLKLTNFLNKTCDTMSRKHKCSTGFSPQSLSWKLDLSLPPYDSITSLKLGMCLISSL